MATVGLYGSTASSTVASPSGSESVGLYGNNTVFGGSYFEWFIFYVSDTLPATPTGGSWDFTTNTGTPPTGWLASPPQNPLNTVWVSIGLVNSKSSVVIVWSAPGKFSFSSGLPILSGTATPLPGDGQSDQLYIQTSTTPETIWFKQAGTWTRMTGSTLYADLTSNQTIAGTKTFSSPIAGSVTGTSANITGILAVANGGTGSTSANNAFNALAPSQTGNSGKYLTTDGANSSWATNPLGTVTSVDVSGGTTGLTTSGGPVTTSGTITLAGTLAVANGGTGVTISSGASSVVLRDSNANITTNNLFEGFTSLAAAGTTTTLLANSTPNYVVTGSGGQTIKLPSATTLPNGSIFSFNNNQSSGTIVVQNNSATTVATIQSGGYVEVILLSNSTAAGSWDVHTQAPSNVSWSTNTFDYAGSITSATWNGVTVAVNRGGTGVTTSTGTGSVVLSTSPTLVTPALGTPSALVGTNITGTAAGLSIGGNAATATNVAYSGLTGTVPTWNQNTTGTAANVTGTVAIANGGTGQTTANAAFNALAPSQTSQSGKYLTTDGTNTSWATNPLGTVTSVAATVPSFLSITGSPITTSGTLAFDLSGTALPTTSGGTGLTSFTANGVVYASSTSALATGTALTFDGSNLGIGTSSPAYKLDVSVGTNTIAQQWQGAGTNFTLRLKSGLGSTGNSSVYRMYMDYLNGSSTNGYIDFYRGAAGNDGYLVFGTSGVDKMTLDSSGNLGIGTSSPGSKLQVVGDVRINSVATATTGIPLYAKQTNADQRGIWIEASATDSEGRLYCDGSTVGIAASYSSTGSYLPIVFLTSATERMRLDTAGNLGLGVTPKFVNGYTAFEVKDASLASSGNSDLELVANGYYNSGWKYRNTFAATRYEQYNGYHTWFNAPSGTAGNAITFTQAMTLDASGNFVVGATSVGNNNSNSFWAAQSYGYCGQNHVNGTGNGTAYMYYAYNGTGIGSVTQSGTTAVLYNVTSDQRLKENIKDADSASALIDALQVRQFDWKTDNTHQRYGFIAQELVTVAPEAVHQPADPEEMMAVDYSKLVPMLVKEIQSLRKRLADAGIA